MDVGPRFGARDPTKHPARWRATRAVYRPAPRYKGGPSRLPNRRDSINQRHDWAADWLLEILERRPYPHPTQDGA